MNAAKVLDDLKRRFPNEPEYQKKQSASHPYYRFP